jgi:hypothetical protein
MFKMLLYCCMMLVMETLVAQENEIIVLSYHVGPEINKAENEQYNIFPAVKDFKHIVFYKLADERYVARVTFVDKHSGEEKVSSWPQTEKSIEQLRLKIAKITNVKEQGTKIRKEIKKKPIAIYDYENLNGKNRIYVLTKDRLEHELVDFKVGKSQIEGVGISRDASGNEIDRKQLKIERANIEYILVEKPRVEYSVGVLFGTALGLAAGFGLILLGFAAGILGD